MNKGLLETYIRLLLERGARQAHLRDERVVEWGSDDHITELEARCADAAYWRDKYPKGSEKRGHYRNVYTHLRNELQSAKKKQQLREREAVQESRDLPGRRSTLSEGGLVGHLQHLYDNRDLTFEEIKTILSNASSGRLEKVTEKMDGMNLVFSYDLVADQVRVTRGSDIKSGGMDAAALAAKFSGRGSVEEAFTGAFRVLEGAIGVLDRDTKAVVFGPSANRWYSMEIIYTKNPNVINYDSDNLVFHGWPVFKREDSGAVEMTEDEVGGVDILTKNIDRMQSAVSATGWKVRGPSLVTMKALSDGTALSRALSSIDSAMADARVGDSDTMGDYLEVLLRQDVESLGLPPELSDMVVDRVLEKPGAPNLTVIKKNLDKSKIDQVRDFVKNSPGLLKGYVRPIEMAINDFALVLLKGLSSTLIGDTDKEVDRLRSEVQRAVSAIQASGDETAMTVLASQMEKLKDVSNITTPMEGVVFIYKGNAYKFTSAFAPMNQILGLFRYSRKK